MYCKVMSNDSRDLSWKPQLMYSVRIFFIGLPFPYDKHMIHP